MKPRLLLVDDDPDTLALLELAAKRSGFFSAVRVASDGQEALNLLESDTVAPELIVSDLRMPRISGIELVKAIKRSPRIADLPVAIITSSQLPEDESAAKAAGACAFFVKGTHAEMAEIFRAILARSRCAPVASA